MEAQLECYSTLFGTARIDLDVLHVIESRLELYEKISLVFLLYDEIAVAQERLSLLLLSQNTAPSVLFDWARTEGSQWKHMLVEALLIIQAHSDLIALDLDVAKLKEHFLPHRLETSLFINPVKKVLYAICEDHTKSDTKDFIESVRTLCGGLEIEKEDYEYLELFLLKLIRNKRINLGIWKSGNEDIAKSNTDENLCDIKLVAKCLNNLKYSKLCDDLISAQNFVNKGAVIYDENKLLNSMNFVENGSTNREAASGSSSYVGNLSIEKYPVHDPKNMGIFLIINQKEFQSSNEHQLQDREGTDFDVERLEKSWSLYGFVVIVVENLPHHMIVKEIKSCMKAVDRFHSAFAVCILSHGQNEEIFGTDGKPLRVTEIKKELLNNQMLIGKPKLLIIQACRGDSIMRVACTKNPNITTDAPQTTRMDHTPEPADLLVFWATVGSYVSYRDKTKGSWFIEALCNCLMNFGDKLHLSDLFTKVNKDLSEKKFQISQIESTWRKILQLQRLS